MMAAMFTHTLERTRESTPTAVERAAEIAIDHALPFIVGLRHYDSGNTTLDSIQ
jgi:hypothetical protein